MSEDSPILVMVHQIGSGRAVAPVVRELRSRRQPLVVGACDLASVAFEQAGIEFSMFNIAPEVMAARAAELLNAIGPAVVLAGTSGGVTFEKVLVETAKRRGIPTIAVLDHWSNYLVRFAGPAGIDHYLPSLLSVMDATARQDLLDLGYASEALAVTGQPAFDNLATIDTERRAEVRGHFALRDNDRLIVFASEPIRRDHGDTLGFHETDVLRMLLDVVEQLPGAPHIIVKPHPTEPSAALDAIVKQSSARATLVGDAPPRDMVLAADVVVGMTSVLLIEAALLGTPAVSLQPGRGPADDFIGVRLGVVEPAYDREACQAVLVRLLNAADRQSIASRARSALHVDGRSAARVADIVETNMRRSAARAVHT